MAAQSHPSANGQKAKMEVRSFIFCQKDYTLRKVEPRET
jgi:hypothetical protein